MLFDLFFACWFTLKLLAGSAMFVAHVPILLCPNDNRTCRTSTSSDRALFGAASVAALCSRSNRANRSCPHTAAKYKGVQPTLSRASTSAQQSSSCFRTSRYPPYDVACSGVWSHPFRTSTSGKCSISNRKTSLCPLNADACN